jgi:hypothetical protein
MNVIVGSTSAGATGYVTDPAPQSDPISSVLRPSLFGSDSWTGLKLAHVEAALSFPEELENAPIEAKEISAVEQELLHERSI